jgi:hypothetical protein
MKREAINIYDPTGEKAQAGKNDGNGCEVEPYVRLGEGSGAVPVLFEAE